MKIKSTILLSSFLCFVFLFRMCFLSFDSISNPAVSYHRSISFKRKLSSFETLKGHDLQEKGFDANAHLLPSISAYKAVQNKRLKLSLHLLLRSVTNFAVGKVTGGSISKHNSFGYAFSSEKKYLSLSILRI